MLGTGWCNLLWQQRLRIHFLYALTNSHISYPHCISILLSSGFSKLLQPITDFRFSRNPFEHLTQAPPPPEGSFLSVTCIDCLEAQILVKCGKTQCLGELPTLTWSYGSWLLAYREKTWKALEEQTFGSWTNIGVPCLLFRVYLTLQTHDLKYSPNLKKKLEGLNVFASNCNMRTDSIHEVGSIKICLTLNFIMYL